MDIIQLSLFDSCEGAESTPAKVIPLSAGRKPAHPEEIAVRPAICEFKEPASRAGFNGGSFLNPCSDCPLKEFCSDDCARLGFPIDVNDPVKAGWKLNKSFKSSKFI